MIQRFRYRGLSYIEANTRSRIASLRRVEILPTLPRLQVASPLLLRENLDYARNLLSLLPVRLLVGRVLQRIEPSKQPQLLEVAYQGRNVLRGLNLPRLSANVFTACSCAKESNAQDRPSAP
jgi:hypothetical protein